MGVRVPLERPPTGTICWPSEMWQLCSGFYGVEREEEHVRCSQRRDGSAAAQEKKAQCEEPQRNWGFA